MNPCRGGRNPVLSHELSEDGEQLDLYRAGGGYVYRAVAHDYFHMLVLRLHQLGGKLFHHFPAGPGGCASGGKSGRGGEQNGYQEYRAFHNVMSVAEGHFPGEGHCEPPGHLIVADSEGEEMHHLGYGGLEGNVVARNHAG